MGPRHDSIPRIRPAARRPRAPPTPDSLVGRRPVRRSVRALLRARRSGRALRARRGDHPHRARSTAGSGSLLCCPGRPQPGTGQDGPRLSTCCGDRAGRTHSGQRLAGEVQDDRPARTAECIRDNGAGAANTVAGRRGASVAVLPSRHGCALHQVRPLVRDASRARRRSDRRTHSAAEQRHHRNDQYRAGRATRFHRCGARLGRSESGMARGGRCGAWRARRHPRGPELPTGRRS